MEALLPRWLICRTRPFGKYSAFVLDECYNKFTFSTKRVLIMKIRFLVMTLFMIAALAGCGGGDVVVTVVPPPIVKQIISDAALDGDIEVGTSVTTITQGVTQSVFVGIDPVTLTETRAFLDFSLASIPLNAIIDSATLDIVVSSIAPSFASLPVLVDLVSYPQPLLAGDFNRALFATTSIVPPIISADVGNHVRVNVTGLMQEAQSRGLSRFQVRLLKGAGGTSTGLVEINDTTGPSRASLAPQLTVAYF